MVKLESIVLLLKHINGKLEKSIFTQKEIQEKLEEAKDSMNTYAEINILLQQLVGVDIKDKDTMEEKLLQLHFKLGDVNSHINEIHDMVKDMIAKYK